MLIYSQTTDMHVASMQDTKTDELQELFKTQDQVTLSLAAAFDLNETFFAETVCKIQVSAKNMMEYVYERAISEFNENGSAINGDTYNDKIRYYDAKYGKCLQASYISLVAITCVVVSFKLEYETRLLFSDVIFLLQVTMKCKNPSLSNVTHHQPQLHQGNLTHFHNNLHQDLHKKLRDLEIRVLEWKGLIRCVSNDGSGW